MAPETVTGYYRYTDIWFDWHGVIPDEENGRMLKAILAHDALVHPEHPLHPGETGIELYHGTFKESGETRLLVSSKQVEYVRYWLHAMKLTKAMVPQPYSDCLILPSELQYVSAKVYKEGGDLRGAIRNLDKHNKRLMGSNPVLLSRRHLLQRTRELVAAKRGTWCAIDFEAWERDHTVTTEIGYSILHWNEKGEEVRENTHWIVKEAESYRNGTYVADYRYSYNFGESERVPKKTLKQRVHELLTGLQEQGPLYLVFHDNSQDIKYLQTLEAPLKDLSYLLPDTNDHSSGLFVVDTSDLFGALIGLGTGERRSLEKTCRMLQIPASFLHNAGNDAYYTLEALKQMAQGEPLDEQRERRWPNHTPSGTVQVEFKPWEDDSDYSDVEEVPTVRNTAAGVDVDMGSGPEVKN